MRSQNVKLSFCFLEVLDCKALLLGVDTKLKFPKQIMHLLIERKYLISISDKIVNNSSVRCLTLSTVAKTF